ncbi:MAG TPA: carbonic anhydrase [Gemmatimonadales bacterium]|nr:carbonic anhydrase [Gemmatimonadales bacterium]
MSLDDLLEKNRQWAAAQLARDPEFFERLARGQHPRLLWIGCSDSRVPAEEVVGCGPGELFVHRNVANIVAYNDVNISSVLEFALRALKVPDIVVCGHTGCGGIKAACASRLPDSYLGDWLMIAARSRDQVRAALDAEGRTVDEDTFHTLVVEQNVRLQMDHLSHLAVVRRQWEETPGLPRLHGWVYDINTGLVRDVTQRDI